MSGKQGGAPKGNTNSANHRLWAEAIKRAIARRGPGLTEGLNKLANKFLDAVENGDVDFKELGDRLDGKAAQAVDLNVDNRTTQRNLADSELLEIATGVRSGGDSGESNGEEQSEVVH